VKIPVGGVLLERRRRRRLLREERDPWRRFRGGLLVLETVLLIGTVGYAALGVPAFDALYQTAITITTVGYGDFVPVTLGGRVTAVLVMLLGVSALSVLSASLAATLVKQGTTPPSPAVEIMGELQELKAMVASLQQQLSAERSDGSATPGG